MLGVPTTVPLASHRTEPNSKNLKVFFFCLVVSRFLVCVFSGLFVLFSIVLFGCGFFVSLRLG